MDLCRWKRGGGNDLKGLRVDGDGDWILKVWLWGGDFIDGWKE